MYPELIKLRKIKYTRFHGIIAEHVHGRFKQDFLPILGVNIVLKTTKVKELNAFSEIVRQILRNQGERL